MKETIKSYIKPCIKILSFLIAFVVLLEALSLTYFSKASASNYNNKYSDTMSFYNEPSKSLQIIAIGNSDLYSGFCPPVIWEKNGYTSTAIGSPRQTPRKSFDLLREALDNQNAEVVIIECDMLYDYNPEENNVKSGRNNLDVMFDYLKPETFEEGINNEISIFMFHDRWKNKKIVNKSNKNHGYKFSEEINPVIVSDDFMAHTENEEHIMPVHINDLKAMITYCNSKGIKVILTTLPSPSSWTYERHNATQRIADEMNVPFVDFNLLADEINLDYKKDFRDKGNHLNYYGAKKVSSYFGDFIEKNYQLKDLRNDKNYDYWNNNHIEFMKQVHRKFV